MSVIRRHFYKIYSMISDNDKYTVPSYIVGLNQSLVSIQGFYVSQAL